MKGHTNNPNGARPKAIANLRFHRLTALEYVGRSRWRCKCDCGNSLIVNTGDLNSGNTKSCGCLRTAKINAFNFKHGYALKRGVSKTWICWSNMKQRCENKNHHKYPCYGARGISVSKEWHKFENFLRDMGDIPRGMTLGREDNNGDYCKDNCRWETIEEQANNTRTNRYVVLNGETLTLAQAARSHNINYHTFYGRIQRGWTPEEAVVR